MYIVINANVCAGELSTGMVAHYTDLESAIECCRRNIAEDFGCENVDEFMKDWGFDYEEKSDINPVYKIGLYDNDCHEEIYQVYKVE